MKTCQRCGCTISQYAMATDRYCWPCHPRIEAHQRRTCDRGHDLTEHGITTRSGSGRTTSRCGICKRAYDRNQAAARRRNRKGTT